MEKCCAKGISVTVTVSFCVPQACAPARRYREVLRKGKPGDMIGKCFAVVMIGRLDDCLRQVFANIEEGVSEQEVRMAGLSVVKNAHKLFRKERLEALLLIAAPRGNCHMTESVPKAERIAEPVPVAVQEKLHRIPEFRRAYDPEGLSENDMITFGPTQRTLSQFTEAGWKLLEHF